MNNTNIKTYSEAEKEIFTNTFIHKGQNSRNDFEAYLGEFFKSLNLENPPYFDKSMYKDVELNRPNTLVIPEGARFNTHDILWDSKTKDNLVTHFLKHPDFQITNTSLHRLNFVHPNWNHQNKDGHNALMILAQRGELHSLIKVMGDFKLDPNKQDKDDRYFTHFLFSPIETESLKNLSYNFFTRVMTHMTYIEHLVEDYPHHFDISKPRLDRVLNQWQDTLIKLQEAGSKMIYANELASDNIQTQGKIILNKMMSHKLEKILEIKETKSVTSKI